jgi:hypothetical protein
VPHPRGNVNGEKIVGAVFCQQEQVLMGLCEAVFDALRHRVWFVPEMDDRGSCPLPLETGPFGGIWSVTCLPLPYWLPEHGHWSKADLQYLIQAFSGLFKGVSGVPDQDIATKTMGLHGESRFQQTPRSIRQWLEFVAGVVGKKTGRTRFQTGEQIDVIILQRQRIQSAGEFGTACLPAQHGKNFFDVRTRAGKQIVIQYVPPIGDHRKRRGFPVLSPGAAKPAAAGTATRGDYITVPEITSGNELQFFFAVGWAAEIDWRDVSPGVGQLFCHRNVRGEGHGHVHLVRFVE